MIVTKHPWLALLIVRIFAMFSESKRPRWIFRLFYPDHLIFVHTGCVLATGEVNVLPIIHTLHIYSIRPRSVDQLSLYWRHWKTIIWFRSCYDGVSFWRVERNYVTRLRCPRGRSIYGTAFTSQYRTHIFMIGWCTSQVYSYLVSFCLFTNIAAELLFRWLLIF